MKLLKEHLTMDTPLQQTTTLEGPNSSNELTLTIQDRSLIKKISFRNVGTLNMDSQIQFTCEEYNRKTNKTKYLCFSVPATMVELFIKHLSGDGAIQ